MTPILEMRGITKKFPGVIALREVNLSVKEGEIHAICGENGAGKSTLMKVLSGVHPYGSYGGQIIYQGEERRFFRIADSEHAGIAIIHQELALAPQLSIAENIFLGNEVATNGVVDWNETFRRARDLMEKVGLKESPNTLITNIGVGKQQLVEIAKALSKKVKLLILDEPTASLNEADSAALLNLLLEFKAQGMTSVLISHKLNEIAKVADSITILRDGATVETIDCHSEAISEGRIIKGMVGREMADRFPARASAIGGELFAIRDWRVEHPQHAGRAVVKGVSLHVNKGEVVGVAGLMGAGRTELAMSVFGRAYGRNITGTATLDGKALKLDTIDDAIAAGLAYVTEDRKTPRTHPHRGHQAQYQPRQSRRRFRARRNRRRARGIGRDPIPDRAPHPLFQHPTRRRSTSRAAISRRSCSSKWLFAEPKVLILDEPTRGIDVGAKYEIYTIINDLAAAGQGRDRHLVRDAGAARHLRSDLRHERGPVRGRNARQGRHSGEDHGVNHAPICGSPPMTAQTQTQADAAALKAEVRGQLWKDNLRDYGLLGSLLLIVVFFDFVTADHASVAPVNVTNLIMQNCYVVIMALGMLLIIVGGNIDLSVGSIVGFVGAIGGSMIVYWKVPYPIVILVCLIARSDHRRGAGLSRRLCADAVVHRDARRHADLPRPHRKHAAGSVRRTLPERLPGHRLGLHPRFHRSQRAGHALPEWAQIRWVSLLIGVAGALRDVRDEHHALASRTAPGDGSRAPRAPDRQEPRFCGNHRRHRLESRAVPRASGHPRHHGRADAALRVHHHAHRRSGAGSTPSAATASRRSFRA